MTCICAVAEDGVVVMGGDSATSTEEGDRTLRDAKVFERSGLLFGSSGELRVGQLVQYVYDVPVPQSGQDVAEFVVRDLCEGLRKFLRKRADELLPSLDDDDEPWQLLIGVQGRVFRMCSHLSVSESVTGYDSIGSGAPLALGSLASTEGQPAAERVDVALRAAERHHGGVAAPFTVLTG